MTPSRKRLTATIKKCLWLRQDKRCADCNVRISLADLDADHMHELWDGGDNEIGNFQLLCFRCHAAKTKRGRAADAKTKRLAAQTAGIEKKRRGRRLESKPFDKALKRTFGSKVELR